MFNINSLKSTLLSITALAFVFSVAAEPEESKMIIVKDGECRTPIIVSMKATLATKRAANELADYVEKISGARPEVIQNDAPSVESAIWVGPHPKIGEVMPGVDLKFEHPEEILIACDGRNLLVIGEGNGTANAVYTFLQDQLGVRWLWPGPLGEDVIKRETIEFASFETRFHPQFRQRGVFRMDPRRFDRNAKRRDVPEVAMETDWRRRQRASNGSLHVKAGCHAFNKWWDRFHEDHPDYFAMQPDGTRSGFPAPKYAKLCESNPAVWKQWASDAANKIGTKPGAAAKVLLAHPTDSHSSGICVCENCLASDHPDGKKFRYAWSGAAREYVAMSDRYVTFWNHLAEELRRRYPGRDDVYLAGAAYGPSTPAPLETVADEKVIISFVGFFPVDAGEENRRRSKENMRAWSEKVSQIHYRPNMFYCAGGVWGLPDVALDDTLEDFKFLADIGCVGLVIDTAWGHWATQGPQYYLMSQLAWNPRQNGEALLADYYQRGFGPAAAEIAEYWKLMDAARAAVVNSPDYQFGQARRYAIINLFPKAFTKELLANADASLKRAEKKAADGPKRYGERVAFVRAGFEFVRMMIENVELMRRARESRGMDAEAVRKVQANWGEIEKIAERYPFAINLEWLMRFMGLGPNIYMGQMRTHLGPPSENLVKAAEEAVRNPELAAKAIENVKKPDAANEFKLISAEDAGWKLVFSDDFDRKELGDDWRAVEGEWTVKDGWLATSGGSLLTTRGFPGFQRLEFEAMTDVKPITVFAGEKPRPTSPSDVCDLSSLIHAREAEDNVTATGYFFQFGGYMNKQNQISKDGRVAAVDDDPKTRIKPGKIHRIVVENDQGRLRLIVDGKLVLNADEESSLVENGQDRVGFYFYTAAKLRNVKVHVKPTRDDFF